MIRLRLSLLFAACLSLALRAQHAEPAPATLPSAVTAPAATPVASAAVPAEHGEAAAHHGPAVTLFGHELSPTQQFFVKLFNFALFAGGLVFVLKGVLARAFKDRAQQLETQLGQAERERAEAESQLKALDQRMAGLQGELDTILSTAEAEAEAERARIVAAARTEAEAILAQARFDIAHQQRQAEQELRALVADLAVEEARKRLEGRLAQGASESVMNQAIAQVGGER